MEFSFYRIKRSILCNNPKCRKELPSGTEVVSEAFLYKGMTVGRKFCKTCGINKAKETRDKINEFFSSIHGKDWK